MPRAIFYALQGDYRVLVAEASTMPNSMPKTAHISKKDQMDVFSFTGLAKLPRWFGFQGTGC